MTKFGSWRFDFWKDLKIRNPLKYQNKIKFPANVPCNGFAIYHPQYSLISHLSCTSVHIIIEIGMKTLPSISSTTEKISLVSLAQLIRAPHTNTSRRWVFFYINKSTKNLIYRAHNHDSSNWIYNWLGWLSMVLCNSRWLRLFRELYKLGLIAL